MPETGTSGLMSGEWKRNARRDIQAPATKRAGSSYGPSYTSPRHSSTLQSQVKEVQASLRSIVRLSAIAIQPAALHSVFS